MLLIGRIIFYDRVAIYTLFLADVWNMSARSSLAIQQDQMV